VRAAGFAAATLLLLAPAIWNGFPLTFYDTGAFVEQAATGNFVAERSVFYSWFLKLFQYQVSLWIPVIAQAALTVWVMGEFARLVSPSLAPERAPGRFLLIVLALCIGTGLPWYAGQVLADIFAPLMVLCLYLLGFHFRALDWPRRAAMLAIVALAATSHASHLGLLGGLAAVAVLALPLARRTRLRVEWKLAALAFALSLALIVASNFARTGEAFFSRAGSAFVFARLLQDGIVKRLLDDTCPASGYVLCVYKDKLPPSANEWLWASDSPFWKLGDFAGTEAESRRIIADSLRRYPLMHLKTAAIATAEQLVTFATGDGIEPQALLWGIFEKYIPDQFAAYKAARQQNEEISFVWINPMHIALGGLSYLALASVLIMAARRPVADWDDKLWLPAYLFAALLGNAFICGVLSNPHDRYQSRLIWMASFAVLLLAARRGENAGAESIPRTA
jgi:hypothetical protein